MSGRGWMVVVLTLCVLWPGDTPRATGQTAPANATASAPAEKAPASGVEGLRADARALRDLVQSSLGREFLHGADGLPPIAPRTLHRSADRSRWIDSKTFAELPEDQREGWTAVEADERFYYTTRYGSSLGYARAIDILGRNGVSTFDGLRVMDFGCGAIGHLRMMAGSGATVVGVDVEPMLPALYNRPEDAGTIRVGKRTGHLSIVTGRWPAQDATRTAVGDGYDLILSKNTLKNGYINPAEEVDPRMLVNLGVPQDEFVRSMFSALRPGGWALIYNFSPAPAPPGKPYIPWADGRCPFPREMLESAGFRVVAYDEVDDEAGRALARALGWDRPPQGMNLETDLFARYTLLQRPANP